MACEPPYSQDGRVTRVLRLIGCATFRIALVTDEFGEGKILGTTQNLSPDRAHAAEGGRGLSRRRFHVHTQKDNSSRERDADDGRFAKKGAHARDGAATGPRAIILHPPWTHGCREHAATASRHSAAWPVRRHAVLASWCQAAADTILGRGDCVCEFRRNVCRLSATARD